MPLAGFEPAIPENKRPQTNALVKSNLFALSKSKDIKEITKTVLLMWRFDM
jgi:hypothetical protein